ncbi:hypothetical protein F53441_12283 [Fusarium austroafricanum]|uniref:Major facilitator superfamily (MFS) profile domain-containing protein n=1 Tax=Fusarium austroafricanum TaxID=2364996 RepID=A0A8H4JWI8_9HYPO|nr:hypothetical protein F53441_12283 [Fusarium austroafricanum]
MPLTRHLPGDSTDQLPILDHHLEIENKSPKPIPNGGLTAWLQVAVSFCLTFCTWGLITTFGTFQTIYERDRLKHSSPFQISLIGSLQTFCMIFSGFPVGPIYDSGYVRQLLGVGSGLIVVGTTLQSFCTQYWHFVLAQGLMVGIGAVCLSILSVAITSSWFTTKLPLVNGLALSGSGLGGVVLPIMIQKLTNQVGLPWAVRGIALLMFVLLAFSNLVYRPGLNVGGATRRPLVDRTAFKDKPYLLFVGGSFCVFLGMYTPFVYVQSYALDDKIVPTDLALSLLAIINCSAIFGRIILSLLAQMVGPMNTIIGSTTLLGVTTFCLIATFTSPRLLATIIFLGFFSGAYFALQPTIFVKLTSDPRVIGTRNTSQWCFGE